MFVDQLDLKDRPVDIPDFAQTRQQKFCPGCERNKPVDEFHRNKGFVTRGKRDGLNPVCKVCVSNNLARARSFTKRARKKTTPPIGSRGVRVVAGQGVVQGKVKPKAATSSPTPPITLNTYRPDVQESETPMADVAARAAIPSRATPTPRALSAVQSFPTLTPLADHLTNPSPVVPSVWVGYGVSVLLTGDPAKPTAQILCTGEARPPFQVPLDGIEWVCRLIAKVGPDVTLEGVVYS